MTTLETSDDGGLHLPPELIGEARPHVTYDFEVFGEIMLIRPAERRSPFWKSATPRQRADAFRGWAGAVEATRCRFARRHV